MNPNMDPAVVAANVYRPVFENSRVRVFRAQFAPGAKAAMHEHPDHVVHTLTNVTLQLTVPGGKTTDVALAAGETIWMTAGQHEAINKGDSEARLLVIELK
jgi:quercetin dioxygenase-like cupin family protein